MKKARNENTSLGFHEGFMVTSKIDGNGIFLPAGRGTTEFINYGIDALRILIPAVRNAVNDEEVNVSSFFWMRFPQAVSLELYDMNAKYLYIVNKP